MQIVIVKYLNDDNKSVIVLILNVVFFVRMSFSEKNMSGSLREVSIARKSGITKCHFSEEDGKYS